MNAELSVDASRLLNHLQTFAARRDRAKTDRQLAAALAIPERDVIELAGELMQHGHLVVAVCKPPMGRWLLRPSASPDDWTEARAYVDGLTRRGKRILVRRQHAESALRRAEAQRRVESTGQRRLF